MDYSNCTYVYLCIELPKKESPRDRNEFYCVSSASSLMKIKQDYNRKTVTMFSLHYLQMMGRRKRWQTERDASPMVGQIWHV